MDFCTLILVFVIIFKSQLNFVVADFGSCLRKILRPKNDKHQNRRNVRNNRVVRIN